ncbi:MAG: hypothetical protein WCF90_10595 [Methanomicrobiales archaeon]
MLAALLSMYIQVTLNRVDCSKQYLVTGSPINLPGTFSGKGLECLIEPDDSSLIVKEEDDISDFIE